MGKTARVRPVPGRYAPNYGTSWWSKNFEKKIIKKHSFISEKFGFQNYFSKIFRGFPRFSDFPRFSENLAIHFKWILMLKSENLKIVKNNFEIQISPRWKNVFWYIFFQKSRTTMKFDIQVRPHRGRPVRDRELLTSTIELIFK